MSDANKETITRVFLELFNEHKLELIPELYAETCLGCDPANGQDLCGHDAILKLLEGYRAAFPRHVYELHEVFAEGSWVCARWSVITDPDDANDDYRVNGISMCQFEDGKICKVFQHWDNLGFLQKIKAVDSEICVPAAVQKLISDG